MSTWYVNVYVNAAGDPYAGNIYTDEKACRIAAGLGMNLEPVVVAHAIPIPDLPTKAVELDGKTWRLKADLWVTDSGMAGGSLSKALDLIWELKNGGAS
jgi:hypothetical protein